MIPDRSYRSFLSVFVLLAVSFLIYFVRYPMWEFFSFIEPIFALEFLSYFIVFVVALLLLKKDSRNSLSSVFRNKGSFMVLMGLLFALLYLGLWYLLSFGLGSRIELTSFPSFRGFENYAVYSLPLAFGFYLAFAVFGAFAEEVAYRGYVQTRIVSRFGDVAGVLVATVFFSLQHIHVFEIVWLSNFFQTQLLHVVLFGIFTGYLFLKSKDNVWSAFAFHGFLNFFSVSVPIVVTHSFQLTYYVAEIASLTVMILLLRYLPIRTQFSWRPT